jgi:sulfite exporter TauE/SafE
MNKNQAKILAALVFLIVLILGYFLIQKYNGLEILLHLSDKNLSFGLIFIVGLLCGFHCIGMCGGLIVTYTAQNKLKPEQKNQFIPHLEYNLGRLISYTIIGAILGGFGSFFIVNPVFSGILMLGAGIFMILMGLSFIFKISWLKKIIPHLPKSFGHFLYNQQNKKESQGPFIIGLLNGLMPCGPLQAMQLYALSTTSIVQGALSMGIYALGTIPMMFGFGSVLSLIKREKIMQLMKVSGIIVVLLGLLMINRGLFNFGFGFNGFGVSQENENNKKNQENFQTAEMTVDYNGYTPNVLYVKKGILVHWIINVKQLSGCTSQILMPDFNIRKNLKVGENIIEFTPNKVGEIKFSCGMKMIWGKFIVN